MQRQQAQDAADKMPVTIGYVELADNPMYDPERAYYMVPVRQWGSPLAGRRARGCRRPDDRRRDQDRVRARRARCGASIDEITPRCAAGQARATLRDRRPAGCRAAGACPDAVADLPVTIFNISANEDSLRGADCRANVVHMIPSYRMLTDAMMQFLVFAAVARDPGAAGAAAAGPADRRCVAAVGAVFRRAHRGGAAVRAEQ